MMKVKKNIRKNLRLISSIILRKLNNRQKNIFLIEKNMQSNFETKEH